MKHSQYDLFDIVQDEMEKLFLFTILIRYK